MPRRSPSSISLAPGVLAALVALNQIAGFVLVLGLVGSLVAGPMMMESVFGVEAGRSPTFLLAWRLLMALGIAGTVASHRVLTQLQMIVATVRAGDPFVTENASRLRRIAWATLGLELLNLAASAVTTRLVPPDSLLHSPWRSSFTPWIAILLLFVLAQVFTEGTRMRDELDGTV